MSPGTPGGTSRGLPAGVPEISCCLLEKSWHFCRDIGRLFQGHRALQSEECRKPQPPLLLKKVSKIRLPFVLQYASTLYCSAFGATELSGKGNTSVLLPFVSQYAFHLYCNTPPICIAILLGKSWWLWSPGCSPLQGLSQKFYVIFSCVPFLLPREMPNYRGGKRWDCRAEKVSF